MTLTLAIGRPTLADRIFSRRLATDIVLIARKGGPAGAFDTKVLEHPKLAPLVARLKLDTPGAVTRRVVGHWATLGPYFEGSYGMPANSDYYPVLDLNAAKGSGSDNGRVSGSLQESREDVGFTEPGAVFDLRSIRKALVSGPAFDLLVWQSC